MTHRLIRHDTICELRLERTPVNALTPDFMFALRDTLRDIEQDDTVRAILITSAVKVTSAGLDLRVVADFDSAGQRAVVEGLDSLFTTLFACPKPTVIAAHGAAIAGGLFFVLASDWRVGGPQARFGLAEVRVGATFPTGPMEIARDQLAPADLRRLMLRGQPYDAATALGAGIIDEISETPETAALVRAQELAELPPKTYAAIKAQSRAPALSRIEQRLSELREAPPRDYFSDETRAAMTAMLEKQP